MIYLIFLSFISVSIYAAEISGLFSRQLLAEMAKKEAQQTKEMTPQKQFLKDVKKGYCQQVIHYLDEHDNVIPAGALHVALENQQQEMATLLLERGVYVNEEYEGLYPLHIAVHACPEYVQSLIARGACVASINKQGGGTPLHRACAKGSDDACKTLITHGASVHARTYNNMTPLHHAAFSGNMSIINQLIEAGSDINAQEKEGMTPLIIAAFKAHRDIVLRLLQLNALVNVQDRDGDTALHSASQQSDWTDVVTQLLDRGASINLKNKKKITPLHFAAFNNNTSVAALLISKGADVWAQDDKGDIPLLVAKDDQTKQVLRNAMRKQQ